MAKQLSHPPSAACLSASMRDLGYSLEAAVADLIDNSISAEATRIDIICELASSSPSLAIVDDGRGMSAQELLTAMRHGSISPKQTRGKNDLGRFGLGLKTASFSQCRQLTLVSARDGELHGAEWNLDLVENEDDWTLLVLDSEEIASLPHIDRLGENGTLVLWRELDRLFEDEEGTRRDEIVNEKLDILERHLSLVFHRFLAGEIKGRRKIAIAVNGHPVEAFDPFCRGNPATGLMPKEIVWVDGVGVHLQPYILPHHSRLSAREYDFYQSRSDFISNQGAYIYRNGRLMAWGDWFRLIPKGEATKLARVQIDFTNELDESWTIDIKKSRARPPHLVRERLRQIINQVVGRSTTVHRGRGQKLFDEVKEPLWDRFVDQAGIRYSVNRDHPLLLRLASGLDDKGARLLDVVLEAVAASLPVEMIYSDYSTQPRHVTQGTYDKDQVTERLKTLRRAFEGLIPMGADDFREVVRSSRLFEGHMDLAEAFIEQEFS